MFGGTRWRLVGWSVLVVGIILASVGAILYLVLTRALMDSVDSSLSSTSQIAEVELHETDVRADEAQRQGYRGGLFYLVMDTSGMILENPQQVDVQSLPDFSRVSDPEFYTIDLVGRPVRVYARPIGGPASEGIVLVLGQSLEAVDAAAQRLLQVMLAGGAIGLLLSFFGAWFLADRALVPIRRAFERQQEFVADASHELRTPLTILHAATDALEQHMDEPLRENRDIVSEVRQEIVRMERLTRDLLTLARSDRGELHLSVGQLDLGALAYDLKERVLPLAVERGIDLEVHVDEPAPVIEADPDRLQQVGLILLDNALNHTPRGGCVRLVVRSERGHGLLSVEDNGEGIPPEHLARVFERFHRVDPSRTRANGGMGGAGLGLAIADRLVAAHAGEIELESELGRGTCVTIRIPLSELSQDSRESPSGSLTRS